MASGRVENETELTSTVECVLSTSTKEEKGDTSDAIPTSSTDASTAATTPHLVSDDPISSTSSELDQNKSAMIQLSGEIPPEEDLLGISISNMAREKITEDVEDLVHDLESLLEGPFPATQKDTKTVQQVKKLTEESHSNKETGEVDIPTSDKLDTQHDVENFEQLSEGVEYTKTEGKVDVEEDKVDTADKVCELVSQNMALGEEQEQEEVDTDVADFSKQNFEVTNLIEDVAVQCQAELNEKIGGSSELPEKEVDMQEDGPSEQQIETAPVSENVDAKSLEHVSDALGDRKDSNGSEDNSELGSEIHEANQTAALQSEEIVQSDAPQDTDDVGELPVTPLETGNSTNVIDNEENVVTSEAEANQIPDDVTVETLVEDAPAVDESAKIGIEDKLVEDSVVDAEEQHGEIPAAVESPTVDNSVKASMDSEDSTKIPSDSGAPTIDSNTESSVDNECNLVDDAAEVSAANEDPVDETIQLSAADQDDPGVCLIEPSVEDENKNDDSVIEMSADDKAGIVDSSEASENNGKASKVMVGEETSSTKNEKPAETQIFAMPADDIIAINPLETDTVNDNLSEAQQIEDELPIQSCTIESIDAQAEDLDITDKTKVPQIEEGLEKEETFEENMEEGAQDLITGGDEVQDDTTVKATVTDISSQNQTEIEAVAVDTEEPEVVETTEEPEEIENLQMSEAAKLEESVEPVEDIGEEAISEHNIETVLEVNQNRIAEALPDETEPTKEAEEDRTTKESVRDESPKSNKEAEGIKELEVDEVIEHERDGDTQESITKELNNECSQFVALVEPAIPVKKTENTSPEVSQEDNITSTQEESVAESICVEQVEKTVEQAEEIPNEYSSKSMGDVENASSSNEVEAVIDEETKAAVDALGAFIDEGIDDPPNVPDEGTVVPVYDDDTECVEVADDELHCGTEGAALVPEDETEAAVKSLAVSVGENIESPSFVSIHEADIIPEYEETAAAVAALTSNEMREESVLYPDQVREMNAVDGTVTTSVEESNSDENPNSSVTVDELIVENQKTADAVKDSVNPSNEVESEVMSTEAESKKSSISAEAIAMQNDETINEEETRAAVEAVISIARKTPDPTSEAVVVSDVETLENKYEKQTPDEIVAIDITTDEKLPRMEALTASVENTGVETSTIPILEAGDYKSPKSVGGATAVSFESEEEMEALALEPDESPPATKASPLASIEEVEEPEEQESHDKTEVSQEAKVAEIKQTTKQVLEIEALKKAVESISEDNSVKGITTETEHDVNEEVEGNEAETEAVRGSDLIMKQDVENNASEVKVIERSGKSVVAMKEANTAVQTTDSIQKDRTEIVNLTQTVEAESTENSTIKEREMRRANERPRRGKRATPDSKLEELSINVDLPEKEKPYSPKVTIRPIKVPDDEISTTSNLDLEVGKGCLKMTITKQSDNTHSILKICDSEPMGAEMAHEEGHIPKLRIKSILPPTEQHSPKSKNKQTYSPTGSSQRSSSPRITIKPVIKSEVSPLKIKIGLKGDEGGKRASPKLSIKAVTEEDSKDIVSSPKKAKSAAKVVEEVEQLHSPRITIKPIPKPEAEEHIQERSSPKITIKPLVKPQESEESHDDDEGAKERIVLKINKGNFPTKDDKSEKLAKITLKLSKEGGAHIVQQSEDNQKRTNDEHGVEKNKKQKTDPKQHPVTEPAMETRSRHKEPDTAAEASKSNSTKHKDPTESPIDAKRSKLSPSPARDARSRSKEVIESEEEELKVIDVRLDSPIVISEDSRSQDSGSCIIIEDTASEISQASFTPDSERHIESEIVDSSEVITPSTPTPRKRGRPRKRKPADTTEVDPLHLPEEVPSPVQVVPPAIKQTATTKQIATSKQIAASKQAALAKQAIAAKAAKASPGSERSAEVAVPVQALHESGRPKRSCRGQSAIDVLGIKPRKPRQPNAAGARGGGRGGKRAAAEARSTVGGLEKDSHKEPDAAGPHCLSPDVILVRDLEVVVPAGDRNKTELKLQQVGRKVVEPPHKERRSAEPVQRERRSAEPPHPQKEPPQKAGKKTPEPSLREKRSERRSAEPPTKSVEPLLKEEPPYQKIKSTEVSPKEAKQIEPQHKLIKATEASTKRGESIEPQYKVRSVEPPGKQEEPPHKQRKITESTKTLLKEVSVAPQQKQIKLIESSPIDKEREVQPEGGPNRQKDLTETEKTLTDAPQKEVTSTHEQSKQLLKEPPQKDKTVVQEKTPALAPPRKLSTETPKRPGGDPNRERSSFSLSKPMIVEEIIDLDPDPPEPPKVAPVEVEARPVEVRVKLQVARRGGRRGIGTRRPTTERRVETVSEVEEKKSSSAETTPLPSPKPPSEKASTPATPQPKSPNPEVPTLDMPLPELTVHVTNIGPVLASTSSSNDVILVDEETRMSADTNSRAQTPAKQVVSEIITIEESQSCSVQSTGNNSESSKTPSFRSNKAPRLEVQENESTTGISPEQLTEYYWNGNGPFMLQEQVAQYLGIKSFKRKYPGIMRRALDMQERDYIREKGLASDHMCDLGLTAVNSADILDIMYADFQDKYEEYCKNLRDRQAKELINKQKALSLAASHEKSKADITTQAVQSAAQWNANFNKTRKEQRRACMDLQTLTVHYPKGRMKPILKPKVGNYPVALVPGQFTDFFKEFTPTEINNLPLNTMLYDELHRIPPDDSEDSGSESDSSSDSDSSSSSSGSDSSSGVEDCKLCKHTTPKKSPNANATANANPVSSPTPVPIPATATVPVTK